MIIYCTTNLINGKIYVGKDAKNNPRYLGSGKLLRQAIIKYGVSSFKKEILQVCSSKEELNEAEKYWIKELKATERGIGYNIAYGGAGGKTTEHPWNKGKTMSPLTEEQKENISIKLKEKYKNKEIENGMKGKDPWNKGTHLAEETKEKIRKKATGRKVSEETRKKHSISMKGKNTYPRADETKEKISKSLKGRKLSEETRKKMKESKKGRTDNAGPIVECPYCGKIGRNNAMRRWHFENCKKKKV